MSRWEKLLMKIVGMSKEMRFAELKKVLESYGYEGRKPSGGGSHWTFRKKGRPPVTVPADEPIKLIYIRKVKEIIDREEGLN